MKSEGKDRFFDTSFDLNKEKKVFISYLLGAVRTFFELKSPKWKQPLSNSENCFLMARLNFHARNQGFKITGSYWTAKQQKIVRNNCNFHHFHNLPP
jgi:hypothetical protein